MNFAESPLRICHVITRMIVGGAQENTLFTIADHVRRGHRVTLVTGPSPGPEGELLKNAELPPFELIELPELVRELSPWEDVQAYRKLRRLFSERKFDVVHTHSSKAGVVGRLAAWKAGVPAVVHTVHGQAFHPYEAWYRNWIYRLAEWYAARHCHRIFSVAQAMIDQCVAAHIAPREKYRVVYSGMEIDSFLTARPEPELAASLGLPPEAQVIGTVARLFPLKGYEFVLPAAFELVRTYPRLHFLLVGDGPLTGELKRRIMAAGCSDRFHFAGLVPPAEVHRYLALMDLLWHLSLREGLPRSVAQALAAGKPAVGFRLDGTPEVLFDGRTGYCVEPESVPEVLRVSRLLLDDPALAEQLGQQGRELVKVQFSHQRMADILEREYRELLAASSRPRN